MVVGFSQKSDSILSGSSRANSAARRELLEAGLGLAPLSARLMGGTVDCSAAVSTQPLHFDTPLPPAPTSTRTQESSEPQGEKEGFTVSG